MVYNGQHNPINLNEHRFINLNSNGVKDTPRRRNCMKSASGGKTSESLKSISGGESIKLTKPDFERPIIMALAWKDACKPSLLHTQKFL